MIKRKEDKQGIDVYISGDTRGEQVHIPVVVASSGVTDEVYNDFHIGEGAMTAAMTESILSMWERTPMCVMRKSITAKVRGPAPEF